MHLLDFATVLSVGMMTGNEFCLSAFINPALWRLGSAPGGLAVSLLARSMGAAMPFWYAPNLILLIAEAVVRRHTPSFALAAAAATLWLAALVLTLTVLLPLNNRLAAGIPDWQPAHRRWDGLHRLRIGLLFAALACIGWVVTS